MRQASETLAGRVDYIDLSSIDALELPAQIGGGTIEMAVEIKRSTSPTLSRGFNLAREVLKPRKTYLVHGGIDTWPIAKGVTAIALVDLMRDLAKH